MKTLSVIFLAFLMVSLVATSRVQIPAVKAQESNFFGNPTLPNWLNVTVSEDSDFVIVDNNDEFLYKFRKGAAGYNEIRQNNSQIVANEQWVLQYLAQAKWKQRGIPQYVTWEQPQAYRVIVKRFYDDFLGTTFNITYYFEGGFRPKIMFNGFLAQQDDYRIKWTISGINKTYVSEKESSVEFWNEDEIPIVFDYEDVYERFGDITTIEIDPWANNHKLNELFYIGVLNGTFKLDPTFGNLNVETAEKNIDGGIRGTAFTCSEDGTANFIMVYLTGWDAGVDVQCCLYKKSDGSIVKVTETRNSGGSDGWHQFDFTAPKPSVENIDYGLLCLAEFHDPHLDTAMRSGAFSVYRYYKYIGSNPMSFPDPFDGTEGTANFRYSIYCDYTATGTEEKQYNLTATVQPSESMDYDAEKQFIHTKIVTIISYMQFQKETVMQLFALLETVKVYSVMDYSKEVSLEFFEFFESINPYALLDYDFEVITPAVDVTTFGTVAFVIAIIALAIGIVAFTRRS